MDALEQHLRDVHAYIANALPGVQFVVGDMNNGPDGRGTVTITIEGRMMEKAQELMSEASVRAFTAWEYAFITSQQATEEQRGVTKAA